MNRPSLCITTALALCGIAVVTRPAVAQTVTAQSPTIHTATCHDFRDNADGSWTALNPIIVEDAGVASAVAAGQSFRPGASFAGDDLGHWLARHCPVAPFNPVPR